MTLRGRTCSDSLVPETNTQTDNHEVLRIHMGLPRGSWVNNPTPDAGDRDSVPGSARSSVGGSDNPRQYSCLGSSMDRGFDGLQPKRLHDDLVAKQQNTYRENKLVAARDRAKEQVIWENALKSYKHIVIIIHGHIMYSIVITPNNTVLFIC